MTDDGQKDELREEVVCRNAPNALKKFLVLKPKNFLLKKEKICDCIGLVCKMNNHDRIVVSRA